MHRQGRRAPYSEPMRCDYCRKSFGLILHRYYRMRFCSADCLQAYQHRLDDRTIIQIRHVEFASQGNGSIPSGVTMGVGGVHGVSTDPEHVDQRRAGIEHGFIEPSLPKPAKVPPSAPST